MLTSAGAASDDPESAGDEPSLNSSPGRPQGLHRPDRSLRSLLAF